jgi:manganese efflux pump family protein
MDWAALIAWVLTAGGGFVLLAIWLKHGGMMQRERGSIRPFVILSHFGLAATGLVLWIIYVASDNSTIAWIAFALLLVVAAIGFGMFALWLAQRRSRGGELQAGPAPPERPAEQRFPPAIVGLHGVLAATTLVLVFLAAADIGS